MCDPGDEKYPPSWDGTGGEVARLEYLRYSEGFLRGLSSLDRDRGVVRLWRALRGVAQTRLRDVDFEKPCAAKGETELAGGRIAFQDELEKPCAAKGETELAGGRIAFQDELKKAFPESALRQLPRLYRGFFADVQWKNDMETLIRDLERAAAELTKGDPNTTISESGTGRLSSRGCTTRRSSISSASLPASSTCLCFASTSSSSTCVAPTSARGPTTRTPTGMICLGSTWTATSQTATSRTTTASMMPATMTRPHGPHRTGAPAAGPTPSRGPMLTMLEV